ncbi:MAG TPA: cupredoxin domain-containing protein [Candidatus Acidoferrales bacterium]|nr:cupredoxin domain-containing protein [Candidatus Acidoferrales bacterium]
MPVRRSLRAALSLLLLGATACAASAPAQPTARPNEVQVFEPAGKPDQWAYTPAEIAVAKGTTIAFVNHGKEFHTVTADAPGRPFDIGLDSGQTRTFTFDAAGVFDYHCGVHPQMKGVVRVCDGACG